MTLLRRQYHENESQISRIFRPLYKDPIFIRETNRSPYRNHRTLPNTCFTNYMSFGLDAAIALKFHDRRARNPMKFSSLWKNKLIYVNESRKYLSDFIRSKMWSLGSYIRLICDGQDQTDAIRNCHSLLILNIPAYVAGTNPWGKSSLVSSITYNVNHSPFAQVDRNPPEHVAINSVDLQDSEADIEQVHEFVTVNNCCRVRQATSLRTTVKNNHFERQSFSDQKIEVVGLSTTAMATIHIGFHGTRITQCNQLRIEFGYPMTAHMDGEPFYLPGSIAINISQADQVLMLRNESK